MKKLLVITLSVLCLGVKGQHLDVEMGVGSGMMYIVEQAQTDDNELKYDPSLNFHGAFRLQFDSSYFNLKLLFQSTNSRVTGQGFYPYYVNPLSSYIPYYNYDGEVSTFSSFLLLERLTKTKKWELGYDFGVGYTVENLIRNFSYNEESYNRQFLSIRLAGLLNYQFGKRSSLTLQPVFFWTDVPNSFNEERYKMAAEDINFLLNIGYNYRLF